MKYDFKFQKGLKLELEWEHLEQIYAIMAYIAKHTKDHQFHQDFKIVEENYKQLLFIQQVQEEAKRIHVCEKCWKEIDMRKDFDNLDTETFESGYERYVHKVCPTTNKGKGYEQ